MINIKQNYSKSLLLFSFLASSQGHATEENPLQGHMAKFGLSYDVTPDLQISVFDTYFSHAKTTNVYTTTAPLNLSPPGGIIISA